MNLTPRRKPEQRGRAAAAYVPFCLAAGPVLSHAKRWLEGAQWLAAEQVRSAVVLALGLVGLTLSLALPGASHAAPQLTGSSPVPDGSSSSQPRLRVALEAFGSLAPDDKANAANSPFLVPIEKGGGGISLSAGYFINRSLELGLRFQGAAHKTTGAPVEYGIGSLLLEFRWFPSKLGSIRPYVMTGLGGSNLVADGGGARTQIRGESAAVGFGALFPLTSRLGLDLAARWQWINWDETRVPVEVPGNDDLYTPNDRSGMTGQLGAGMSFFF